MNPTRLESLAKSFKNGKITTYKTHDYIIKPGDNPNFIYLLHKGTVRKYFFSISGHEHTVTLYKSGDYFPWSILLKEFPNNFYYQALTPVELYAKPYTQVITLLKKNSQLSFNLFLNRIGYTFTDRLRLDFSYAGNAYLKTLFTILYLVEFAGVEEDGHYEIQPYFSQEQIASIAGLSRERVNIEMEKIKSKKLIAYSYKHIIIPSLANLKKEISNLS